MAKVSTGFRQLDDLLGALRTGDNVVWQTEPGAALDPFLSGFLRRSSSAPALLYASFHVPPAGVLDRFGPVWERERFVLLDCFTDGLGGSDPTFGRFYRSKRAREVRVSRMREAGDPDAVQEHLSQLEDELGGGTRYVFDSLTGMQELWNSEAALGLFLRSCPRLYEMRTVAYWILDRDAHARSFLARLAHTTQVVLDIRSSEAGHELAVVKAQGRPSEVGGRRLRFTFDGERLRVVKASTVPRERLGDQLKSRRIARGLSQAELARRLEISASALSQAERGKAPLSDETLTRAWGILGEELEQQARKPGYEVSRRGARRTTDLAPGLVSEEILESPSTGWVHLLTFAPGSVGRRPPFSTKLPETAVVLSGVLEVRVGEARDVLHAGDAVVLRGEPISAWRNPGPEEARVLWSVLPGGADS
jgi:transcriptional regulator with XRE-family HTH domain